MPNEPVVPGSSLTGGMLAVFGGFWLWLVIGHKFGFLIGGIPSVLSASGFYILTIQSPPERAATIKSLLYTGIPLFALSALLLSGLNVTWGGDGLQMWICAGAFGFGLASIPVVWRHLNRYGTGSQAVPDASAGPLPTPAPAAPPAADPFDFDPARFHAARPPPRPSRFVPLIEKFSIDLSSDEQAYKFAEGLKASARDHMLRMLDDEINDPATSAELRRFLRQVRAHLAGDVPPGGGALDNDRRRALPPQDG